MFGGFTPATFPFHAKESARCTGAAVGLKAGKKQPTIWCNSECGPQFSGDDSGYLMAQAERASSDAASASRTKYRLGTGLAIVARFSCSLSESRR
jgi:hypothetical protein